MIMGSRIFPSCKYTLKGLYAIIAHHDGPAVPVSSELVDVRMSKHTNSWLHIYGYFRRMKCY
jgi:hypothetical protein